MKMHGRVQKERRDRRKGDEKKTDSEDTEPEEEFKGEMDNFQDLQLGSRTPVVRREVNSPRPLLTTSFLQDMNRPFVL